MPTKPATLFQWATDTNYVGGPEDGTATKSAPSGARQAEGFEPNTKPAAQEFNWILNLIGEWIEWAQQDRVDAYAASEWMSPGNTVNVVDGHLVLDAAQTYYLPIRCAVGDIIKRIDFEIFGNGSDDLTLKFVRRELGVDTDIDGGADNFPDASASWDLVDFDLTDTTVVMGRTYYLKATVNGNNVRIGGLFVTRTPA